MTMYFASKEQAENYARVNNLNGLIKENKKQIIPFMRWELLL